MPSASSALFFGGVLGLLQAIFLITAAKPLLQFMGVKSDMFLIYLGKHQGLLSERRKWAIYRMQNWEGYDYYATCTYLGSTQQQNFHVLYDTKNSRLKSL
ncbi:hypothetical protein Sjap_015480 [Stephania japonica]|uniref:Uncharacterized protein n=1 Tax=Stephania japonica TaxID=461633 RepID=A0AAP0IJC2_9MAGN